jgi:hypothetical protein
MRPSPRSPSLSCVDLVNFVSASSHSIRSASAERLSKAVLACWGFFCIYFILALGFIFEIVHKLLQIFDPEPLMIYVGRG